MTMGLILQLRVDIAKLCFLLYFDGKCFFFSSNYQYVGAKPAKCFMDFFYFLILAGATLYECSFRIALVCAVIIVN